MASLLALANTLDQILELLVAPAINDDFSAERILRLRGMIQTCSEMVRAGRVDWHDWNNQRAERLLDALDGLLAGIEMPGFRRRAIRKQLPTEQQNLWNSWMTVPRNEAKAARYARDQLYLTDAPWLPELQKDALKALLRLRAIDQDSRQPAREIAREINPRIGEESLKDPLVELKAKGLVQSRRYRGGGTWLTPSGRARAEGLPK